MIDFETVLVPVDFSPAADTAFDRALDLVSGDAAQVIALHVLDPTLVEFATAHELGEHRDVARRMRERAERLLRGYTDRTSERVSVKTLLVEGVPFLEIVKLAEELVVDAVVMSKLGRRRGIEDLLFGTTAERVIRTSRRPVIVLPAGSD